MRDDARFERASGYRLATRVRSLWPRVEEQLRQSAVAAQAQAASMAGNPNRPLTGVWGGGGSPLVAAPPSMMHSTPPAARPGPPPEESMFWDYQGGDYGKQQPPQRQEENNFPNLGGGGRPAGVWVSTHEHPLLVSSLRFASFRWPLQACLALILRPSSLGDPFHLAVGLSVSRPL
eukprot:1193996-Prorocentrum_minimum.AAC.2